MNDLIGILGSSITIAKGMYEISKEYNNTAYIKQNSELTLKLAQAQNEAAQITMELQALKNETEEQKNNPLHYNGTTYRDTKDMPYCPACYDDKNKRIHLKRDPELKSSFICPICQNEFEEDD